MLFCQENTCVKQIQKNSTSLTERVECPKNTIHTTKNLNQVENSKSIKMFVETTILGFQID